MTKSLLRRNASFAPLELHFTVVRDSKKWGSNAPLWQTLGGRMLFADAPLDANGTKPPERMARRLRCLQTQTRQVILIEHYVSSQAVSSGRAVCPDDEVSTCAR